MEGKERTPNAGGEKKVEDEPCVEWVLVANNDAEMIVDLGNNNMIPGNLDDNDMIYDDQMTDIMVSHTEILVLENIKDSMEVLQNAEDFSMVGYGDRVRISLQDQSSI